MQCTVLHFTIYVLVCGSFEKGNQFLDLSLTFAVIYEVRKNVNPLLQRYLMRVWISVIGLGARAFCGSTNYARFVCKVARVFCLTPLKTFLICYSAFMIQAHVLK